MSDEEKVKNLEELFKMLGVDTSCEISFKTEHLGQPNMKIRGTKPSIMSGLNLVMIYCMDSLFDNTKEKLDCLNRIYMDAKREIIRRGEDNERDETTDLFNEENPCEE